MRRLEPAHWIALGVALLLLPRLGRAPLHAPWESRHAAIAARLAADGPGSAFTPTLDEQAYLERPPAAYWPAAAAVRALGAGRFAERLPAALCGILLAWGAFVLVRRARGARAAALVAGVAATTPLAAWLFRSALPEAPAAAASALAFLALAVAAVDPHAPRRFGWTGWILLGLAAGLGGLPAALPPLIALAAVAAFGGGRPAWGALRPVIGLAVAVAVAAPLVVPSLALHGSAAVRAFVRPDVAEESPADDEKLQGTGRPDDRMGFDTDLEALAWGAFPWSALLPAALIGLAWRRRTAAPSDAAAEATPGGARAGASGPDADAASVEPGRLFDHACLAWLVAALGTTMLLGDRFHHDPYGALLPLAVVVGLYVARKVEGEWSVADAVLIVAGLGLLAVFARDLSGGERLVRAAAYFAAPVVTLGHAAARALRVLLLGGAGTVAGVLLAVLLARRWNRWLAAAAIGGALLWMIGVLHVLAPAAG